MFSILRSMFLFSKQYILTCIFDVYLKLYYMYIFIYIYLFYIYVRNMCFVIIFDKRYFFYIAFKSITYILYYIYIYISVWDNEQVVLSLSSFQGRYGEYLDV